MTEPQPAIPAKARGIHNHHMASTIWNDFRFRDCAKWLNTGKAA